MFVGQRKRLLLPLLFAVPTINGSRFNMYNGVDTFRRSAETILSLVTHGSRFKKIYCWGQIFRRSTETTFFCHRRQSFQNWRRFRRVGCTAVLAILYLVDIVRKNLIVGSF